LSDLFINKSAEETDKINPGPDIQKFSVNTEILKSCENNSLLSPSSSISSRSSSSLLTISPRVFSPNQFIDFAKDDISNSKLSYNNNKRKISCDGDYDNNEIKKINKQDEFLSKNEKINKQDVRVQNKDLRASNNNKTFEIDFNSMTKAKIETCKGDIDLNNIECFLETDDLWKKFHELGTEMIITKSGRYRITLYLNHKIKLKEF
jgi:hypothetical protein